jgi:hypothetical protein
MSAPKLWPALLGGLFIGVLSSLPFVRSGNACCCLWVVSGGTLAAWLMQQNSPRPVTPGEGALVGLMAGVCGAVFGGVIFAGFALALGGGTVLEDFRRGLENGARDPQTRALVEGMGPLIFAGIACVVWAIVNAVFATVGGLIGALIFRRRAGGMPPPQAPPPSGFTPPTFTPLVPPAPAPPAPPAPPTLPPPMASAGPPALASWETALTLPPQRPPAPPAAADPTPDPEPYAGDAPTILIPMRGPTLGPPTPAVPPLPPPGDPEPESH